MVRGQPASLSWDTEPHGRPTAQGNTSVLTLVAIESSSGLAIFGYIIRRGIKGIYIFQNIDKRSFIDCYRKVIADVVDAAWPLLLGSPRAWFKQVEAIFIFR